jgi:hypothetical protein
MRAVKAAAAAVAIALTAACSAIGDVGETPLETAHDACADLDAGTGEESWFEKQGVREPKEERAFADAYRLADEGRTLIIESEGEKDYTGYLAYLCITAELETSERDTSSIANTTSTMGRQSSKDGGPHLRIHMSPQAMDYTS